MRMGKRGNHPHSPFFASLGEVSIYFFLAACSISFMTGSLLACTYLSASYNPVFFMNKPTRKKHNIKPSIINMSTLVVNSTLNKYFKPPKIMITSGIKPYILLAVLRPSSK